MYCTYILTIASIKMFLRNRQALFFSLFMPLIILFIFGSMDFDKPSRMHIGLGTHHPSPLTEQVLKRVPSNDALSFETGSLESELKELRDGNRNAVLEIPDDLLAPASGSEARPLNVYLNAGRPVESHMALSILNQFADHISLAAAHAPVLYSLKEQSVSAHNWRYIEFLLPGIIAMAIMQMSVFSVAFVFARYKEQGILKRLMATPMRSSQFVTANIITRLLMALVQGAIFVTLGIINFHVNVAGAYWLLTVCVILGSLMFLGMGFLISGLSKTVETVPLLANILVFPMLFVGNIFFSSNSMPAWLKIFAGYLPLTYFSNALRGVMTDGAGPWEIKGELIGMLVWSVVLIGLATLAFRKQERENG